tara:strand:- start:417 stop:839 length:423 start_codon:yes stop_codon:yes gene_type:complete
MKKYRVYRNLNNGLLSIQDRKTGLIVGYAESLKMEGCDFIVRLKGRELAREEKQRNVHAFIIGIICDVSGFTPRKDRQIELSERQKTSFTFLPVTVTYNPFKYDHFVIIESTNDSLNGNYISHADMVEIEKSGKITAYLA